MLPFKRIGDFFLTFLESSNIHGFGHLAARKRHPVETLLWLTLMVIGIFAAINLSGLFLTRYMENPTVISMERDKFSFNTTFPTATICPTTKLDKTLLDRYVQQSQATNKSLLAEFLETISNASYENFETVVEYDEIRPEEYMDIMAKLKLAFSPSITISATTSAQPHLDMVISEMGLCYTYNSQLAFYNNPKYWSDNRWDVQKDNTIFYINPLDGEISANIVNISSGYKLIFHGPFDVADVASQTINAPNGYLIQAHLTALSIYSSDRTRGLNINQRKCRFYDESNLRRSPVYSYVLCRMECRLNLAKKLCGCIPHFYRKLDGDVICNVKGLHCLAKYKERLITLKKECNCYANCVEDNFFLQDIDSREWFLGSNLQWGLKDYPRMRLKRDVIFGFSDVLVYIGGMAGLIFGCSVLSFIEIFYFFTLRLFWFCVGMPNNQDKNKKIPEQREWKS